MLKSLLKMKKITKQMINNIDTSLLSTELLNKCSPREIVWLLANHHTQRPTCKSCQNTVTFNSKKSCYRLYCQMCARGSPETLAKKKATNIKKYGVDNPSKVKRIRQKAENTMIKKYGTKHAMQSAQFVQKAKETNKEKYGTEWAGSAESTKLKRKNTNLFRYGVENTFQSDEIKEKIKRTIQAKYGVDHIMLLQKTKDKIKITNLKKYGVENPRQLAEIIEKSKETSVEKYGVDHYAKRNYLPETLDILSSKEKLSTLLDTKSPIILSTELNVVITTIYDYIRKHNIVDYKCNTSYLEQEMSDYLTDTNLNFTKNNRKILNGQELDFYLPDYNLAIEMNGDYWHSSQFKNPGYHQNKWKECNNNGIHLLSIFESEWNQQPQKYKDLIVSLTNNRKTTIGARKTSITSINSKLARQFLTKFHLQNFVGGQHFGAFYNNQLVSVMTFGITRNGRFELKRFVTDTQHSYPGLFSKMFKTAQEDLGFTEVVSFSDNRWFTGNVYHQTGFLCTKEMPPSYHYLYKGKLTHMMNFTKLNIKKKFPHMTELLNNGITERDAMEYLGIPRIYDCGKKEWIWIK